MQAGYEPEPERGVQEGEGKEREIQEGEGKEHEQMKEYKRVNKGGGSPLTCRLLCGMLILSG